MQNDVCKHIHKYIYICVCAYVYSKERRETRITAITQIHRKGAIGDVDINGSWYEINQRIPVDSERRRVCSRSLLFTYRQCEIKWSTAQQRNAEFRFGAPRKRWRMASSVSGGGKSWKRISRIRGAASPQAAVDRSNNTDDCSHVVSISYRTDFASVGFDRNWVKARYWNCPDMEREW